MNLTKIGSPFLPEPIILQTISPSVGIEPENPPIDGVVVDDEQSLYFEQLSKLYQFNFVDLDPAFNAAHFFAVREQVSKIETLILEHLLFDVDIIREQVAKILWIENHEKKMAELGLALFYLDRDGELPNATSLLEHRAQDITTQIVDCLNRRAAITDDHTVPSGKTDIILREFAQMVFCRPCVYNPGGLIAIQMLLKDPKLLISNFLNSDHRTRILTIVEQIACHSSFDLLFSKKVEVYPKLQDTIRLCLKLAPDAEITSIFVFQAILIALFSDIRQNGAPNCYAIAALIYISENYTYKFFKMMIKWLAEGYYDLDPLTTIPIRKLIKQRMFYPKDLVTELPAHKVPSLVVFKQIAKALSLTTPTLKEEMQPLCSTLYTILADNGALKHKAYAEALYSSYKLNPLNQMATAILEFAYTNGENTVPPSKFELKSFLVDSIMCSLCNALKLPLLRLNTDFMDLLKARLGERLRLHCENHDVVFQDQGDLVVGSQRISFSVGDAPHLSSLLQTSIQVYGFDQGKYLSIPTFSTLQGFILRLIKELSDLLTMQGNSDALFALHLDAATRSHPFRMHLASFFLEKINSDELSVQELEQSDLLFMSQRGGTAEEALNIVFGQKVRVEKLNNCFTPYQFLESLLLKINNLDLSPLKLAKKILLKTNDHVWTLNPHCWNLMLNCQRDFYNFIQNNVFFPAKQRLATIADKELIERVIRQYTSSKKEQQALRNYLSEHQFLSLAALKERLLSFAPPEKFEAMTKAIETEFGKTLLSKKELSTLLSSLNVKLSGKQFNNLYDRVKGKKERASQLALKIQEGLIEEKVCIVEPYNLEVALCKLKQLPIPIFLGDLNWMDSYREDPEHVYLMIVFSWKDQRPRYCVRKNGEETFEKNSEYTKFRILYPD